LRCGNGLEGIDLPKQLVQKRRLVCVKSSVS
jgi:hypothetical protein